MNRMWGESNAGFDPFFVLLKATHGAKTDDGPTPAPSKNAVSTSILGCFRQPGSGEFVPEKKILACIDENRLRNPFIQGLNY